VEHKSPAGPSELNEWRTRFLELARKYDTLEAERGKLLDANAAFLSENSKLIHENANLREALESIKMLSRVPLITDIAESAPEVGDG
jgi:hypothetical protein